MQHHSELSFHATEDLTQELAKRYTQLLIVGEFTRQAPTSYIHVQHFGSHISAVGLADYARTALLGSIDSARAPDGSANPDVPIQ